MLRLVETFHPDILLLDLQLPEGSGLVLLPQLQARSPRTLKMTMCGGQHLIRSMEEQRPMNKAELVWKMAQAADLTLPHAAGSCFGYGADTGVQMNRSSPRQRVLMHLELRIALVATDLLHIEDFIGAVGVHQHDKDSPFGVHGA
jgi:hypothetical protein